MSQHRRRVITGVAVLLVAAGLGVAPAQAAERRVTSGADSGPGTLRALVEQANNTPGEDTIVIPAGMTVELDTQIELTETLTVTGEDEASSVVRANGSVNSSGLFTQNSGVLNLSRVTLEYAHWSGTMYESLSPPEDLVPMNWDVVTVNGGGNANVVRLSDVTEPVTFRRLTVTDARAFIEKYSQAFSAPILVQDSAFSGMDAWGVKTGGTEVEHSASLTFENVFFEGRLPLVEYDYLNIEEGRVAPFLRINRSTVIGDTPLYLDGVTEDPSAHSGAYVALVQNSTIVSSGENGMYLKGANPEWRFRFENSTVAGLALGKAISAYRGTIELDSVTQIGSIEAPGAAVSRNSVIITDEGNDPIQCSEDAACFSGTGNASTVPLPDPSAGIVLSEAEMRLGDLAPAPGNPAPVRIPAPDSPLVDAGAGSELSTDQRGMARPSGAGLDIGAVELQAATLAIGDAGLVNAGENAVFPIEVIDPGEVPGELTLATVDGNAVAGTDYTATEQRLTWDAGQAQSATVTVPTLTGPPRDGKSFTVQAMGEHPGAIVSPDRGTATLVAEQPPITPPPDLDGDSDADGVLDADANVDADTDTDSGEEVDADGAPAGDADGGADPRPTSPGSELANTGTNAAPIPALVFGSLGLIAGAALWARRRRA